MSSTTSVTSQIRMHLPSAGDDVSTVPTVPTTLVYSPADPYAVQATMHTTSGPVAWVFSRELLHAGLEQPAGLGDLHIAPCTDEDGRPYLSIELSTPGGAAVLHADAAEIAAFLADTFLAVPCGHESAHLDIDGALAALLAEG